MLANENLQREKGSFEKERTAFQATINQLEKENKTKSEKLHHYEMENNDHTMAKEAHQQECGHALRVKYSRYVEV